ncbi:MAG: terminase small subunit, partial [Candidatus Binatia bacterium]|nr:terminase small subunit [Candidatus Binatia bacterium]
AEILAKLAEKTAVTVESIAAELNEDRALAHRIEQAGAAVSASLGKAKLYGFLKDKHEFSGTIEHRITDARSEVERKMAGLAAARGA